jgi:hypothetical protein|tara:strand:- start:2929 stop:3228 length:300 start_codon:yes stop_codon:yes gene_type:complete
MTERSLLNKLKRRTSSTVPFGYELSEKDSQYLEPIEKQLVALETVEEMILNEELSLRDGCYWLEDYTGRSLSPAGLKKIIDNKYGTRQDRQEQLINFSS